jgi:L-ascorbate metabolism protein UlaG (beta-lactamase superfamily)
MEIRWTGHSCFTIKGKEKTLITDPCHPNLGYSLSESKPDIVTISHFHPGHSYIEGITNNPKYIKGPGEYEIGKTFITGIATFHDNEKGKLRGKNTVYLIEMDGLTLCHLGDLGHAPTSQLVEEIGGVDILFLPVGEVSTITIDTATEILRQLEAHIVIPMHYKTDVIPRELEPISKFLKKMGIPEAEPQSKLSITPSTLPASTQVMILDYSRSL